MEKRHQIPEAFAELFEPKRYKVFYGGRGAGKSQAFAVALLIIGIMRPIRVLCARELQISISDSVHKLLSDIIRQNGFEHHYDILQTTIRGHNGTEFLFKGLKHNTTEIKGFEGVDYVWVEEAVNVSSNSWELLIPTIRKEGSEIWISFNPKNANDPTYTRFVKKPPEDSIVKKVSWRDNPFFPDVLNKERLALKESDPEAYQHIWEGEFDSRHSGAIFGMEMDLLEREGRVIYDLKPVPNIKVHTAWDLGNDDANVIIFFQILRDQMRVIDCYADHYKSFKHYAAVLSDKGYDYGFDFLPHDSKVYESGTGRTRAEELALNGRKVKFVINARRDDGINAARTTLARTVFNAEKCLMLVEALKTYHRTFDEDNRTFLSTPVHDWSSNYADSFRYLSLVWREHVEKNISQENIKEGLTTDPESGRQVLRINLLDRLNKKAKINAERARRNR